MVIISNHVCKYDPVFVALALKKPLYFVAMDDLASRKHFGPFLRFCFNIIPKSKSVSDYKCVKTMLKVKNEGLKLVLFPEGNRNYNGRLGTIEDSTAKMLKTFKVPIAFLNIIGGYGTDPRWGKRYRRGYNTIKLRYLMMPDEAQSLSIDDMNKRMNEYLTVDDYALGGPYKGKNKANYMERILFRCPDCGAISHLYTKGDDIFCDACGYNARYQEDLTFKLIKGNTYVKTVGDWDDLDRKWIESLDFTKDQGVIFEDNDVTLFKVFRLDPKIPLMEHANLKAYNDRFIFKNETQEKVFMFSDLRAACAVGKNRSNFYTQEEAFQIAGFDKLNAFKYSMLYYHYENTQKGINGNNEFLGI